MNLSAHSLTAKVDRLSVDGQASDPTNSPALAKREERPVETREAAVRIRSARANLRGGSSVVERPALTGTPRAKDEIDRKASDDSKRTAASMSMESNVVGVMHNMHEVGGSNPSPRANRTHDGHARKKIGNRLQFRWKEPLGRPECPYAYRTILNLGWFSFRVHRWIRSDDKRHLHDHPWGFITIVLRGSYTDVSQANMWAPLVRDRLTVGSIRYRPATHRHYVDAPEGGALTFLITGPKIRDWGFWVEGVMKRPLRYFGRYGHPACGEQ